MSAVEQMISLTIRWNSKPTWHLISQLPRSPKAVFVFCMPFLPSINAKVKMSMYFYLTLSCLEQCVVLSITPSGMIFSLHTRFILYPETCSNFYILLSTSFLCKPLQFDSPSSSSKSPSHTLKLIYWKSPPIKFNIIFSIMFFVILSIALYITDFLFSFKFFFFWIPLYCIILALLFLCSCVQLILKCAY